MIDSSHEPDRSEKPRYRTVVEGMELANDFARSCKSMSAFARERGLPLRVVQYWTTRARQLAAAATAPADLVQVAEITRTGAIKPARPALPPPTAAPDAIAVTTAPSPTQATIEVRMPNGVRIAIGAGFSPAALTQVITCLGGRPC